MNDKSALTKDTALSLVNTGKLSENQLIRVGRESDNFEVWNLIIEKLEFGKRDPSQLIELGRETVDNPIVWKAIVETGKLDKDQLVEVGRKMLDRAVRAAIIKTNRLNDTQLLALWNYDEVLGVMIVMTGKLDKDQLLFLGHEAKNPRIWEAIVTQLSAE